MALAKFLKAAKEIEADAQARKLEPKSGHGAGGHDESNWLISYADMMTLLCGFFIMLFSMSHLDEPKFEKVKEAVAKEFKGEYKAPNADLAKLVTSVIQEAGIASEATVQSDALGVAVTFQSTLFFDTLSAEVKPEGKIALMRLIDGVAKRQASENKTYRIVVEGHTDGQPILGGPFPSNWELSGARSARVIRMFLDRGYAPETLASIGYADTRPLVPHRTPSGEWNTEGLLKNRRVVIRILDPKVDAIPLPKSEPSRSESAGASAIPLIPPLPDRQVAAAPGSPSVPAAPAIAVPAPAGPVPVLIAPTPIADLPAVPAH